MNEKRNGADSRSAPSQHHEISEGLCIASDSRRRYVKSEAVDFDFEAVERALGESEESAVGHCSCIADAHPDAAAFLERLSFIALSTSAKEPVGRSLGISFVAACYVLRLDCVRKESLRSLALQIGLSHEWFRRYVAAWCAVLDVPPPNRKATVTSASELARKSARRARKEAA